MKLILATNGKLTFNMKHTHYSLLLFFTLIFFVSCSEDDPGIEPQFSTETFEASFNINPNNFPAGAGLNLTAGDTGRIVQLDEESSFEWDIKMITYRTGQGGRPGIFLAVNDQENNHVKALNVSATHAIANGSSGFSDFTLVTQSMQDQLAADGIFNFDPSTDVDSSGKPDAQKLQTAYNNLVIGNQIVNLNESEQPVFLVQTKDGILFKFQMVKREQGGVTTFRWSRFSPDSID